MENGYNMNNKLRGQALIIANEFGKEGITVMRGFKLDSRPGYKADLKMMEELFTRLDFRVIRHENLKAKEMTESMRIAARDPINKECDCFVMVLSTHGVEFKCANAKDKSGKTSGNVWKNAVFGNDGCPIFVEDIVKIFLDDYTFELRGKPKLFFIQACRSRPENPVTFSKYDFGHWIYSEVNVMEDVDDLYGDMKVLSIRNEAGEDSISSCYRQTEREKENLSTFLPRQMEDGPGDEEQEPFEEASFDINPVNCPDDFLFMYPVMPGKTAIRDSFGSLLLQYMYKGENVERLFSGYNLLQYLTLVSHDMGELEYRPDLEMKSESEKNKTKKLQKYLSSSVKKLSEDTELLMKVLASDHAEKIKTMEGRIFVQEYLTENLEKLTVTEMQRLLESLMPIKMCACIIHRLRDDIVFTQKSDKSPLAKVINYLKEKLRKSHVRQVQM